MAYNNPQLIKILAVIVKKPGNNVCADCSMPNPTWASFNLGVFICMNCSGVHRMLGTHITRIRSITLDHWDEAGVQTMAQVGNRLANSYWEAKLPPISKINANTDEQTRTRFIRAKYEQRLWYGQPAEGANMATDDTQQVRLHPEEAGMTREQKIALRQQQRMGGIQSPTSPPVVQQPVRPPMSQTPQPLANGHFAAANNGGFDFAGGPSHGHQQHVHSSQPPLRHATSSPQIATGGGDLFAGLTPKAHTPAPQQYQQQYASSPPPAAAQPARPKRITGASPWVQRPAGSEPPVAAMGAMSVGSSSSPTSAANAYASMLQSPETSSPVDLMSFQTSPVHHHHHHHQQQQPAAAGFDFLGESNGGDAPVAVPGGADAGSAFSFLGGDDGSTQPPSHPSTEAASGFDFVSDSSAPGAPSGFDFVGDSYGASDAAAPAAVEKPHKPRVAEDVFSDLVPDDLGINEPPALAPLEPLAPVVAEPRKQSGDALGAATTVTQPPAHVAGGGLAPGAHPQGGHPAYPYGYYPPPGHLPPGAAPPAGAPHPHYPYPHYPYPPPQAAGPPPAAGAPHAHYSPHPHYPYPPPGHYPPHAYPPHAYPPHAQPPPGAAPGHGVPRSDPFAVVNPLQPAAPLAAAPVQQEQSAFGFF